MLSTLSTPPQPDGNYVNALEADGTAGAAGAQPPSSVIHLEADGLRRNYSRRKLHAFFCSAVRIFPATENSRVTQPTVIGSGETTGQGHLVGAAPTLGCPG